MLVGSGVSILAPGDVSPGHMMLAPLKMNRMAPLSTCTLGSRSGSMIHVACHKWEQAQLSLLATLGLAHIYVEALVLANKAHRAV